MTPEEVLTRLDKHEAECNLRYKNIEEQLTTTKECIKALDVRLWGLGALIISVAVAENLFR